MRSITATILATALLASSTFAASADTSALTSGKPAGVKKAELAGGHGILLIAGIAVIAGGIALVASQSNSNSSVAVSTSGTAP